MSTPRPPASLDRFMDRATIAPFYAGPRVFDSNDEPGIRLTVRAANHEAVRVRISGARFKTIPHARWPAFIASWTPREPYGKELRHR